MATASVNVIGAGLAGSLVTHLLRREGFKANLIDDGDPRAASRSSSNLFIASWLKKFPGTETAKGLKVLEELFVDKIDRPFSGGIAAAAQVRHVHQRHILIEPDYRARVSSVDPDGAFLVNSSGQTFRFQAPTILCTGYRAADLAPGIKVDIKVGHALYIAGKLAPGQSKISLVSPYVHGKLYQYDADTIYYADSVAVAPAKYDQQSDMLLLRTKMRAEFALGRSIVVKDIKVGYRPIIEGAEFGLLKEVRPNVFVLNGGGKNGMVAYAARALDLVNMLKERAAA